MPKRPSLSRPWCVTFVGALVACSGEGTSPPSPAPCVDSAGARAFSLGAQCLRLTSARARSAGTVVPLALADVVVTSLGDSAIAVRTSAVAPVEAFELTFTGAAGTAMLQEGYQSWSFSGATALSSAVPRAPDGLLAGKAAATGDPLDEVLGVSYGAALVGVPGGASIAIAATSSQVASTAIGATRDDSGTTLTILYGAAREPLPVVDGKVSMPAIVLAASDAKGSSALVRVVTELSRALPADARPPQRPIGGWYSWNQLFDGVDEAAVRAHVDLVATKLAPLGLPLVEIDDGWEVAWGDWRANAKFASGMDGVAKAITDRGLRAGVWLAPFLVDVGSDVAKGADPTLFVRGSDGKPLSHRPSGGTRVYFVLDATNPRSMELVTKPIAALAAAGFTFFKLDFLYAGALPGLRADASATGQQALHVGLASLRAAMGPAATFDACGAPVFPLLGVADALRIGSDTAFSGLSLNWGAIAFAARSTAARAFLAPLVFLDGDQTQVRDPYSTDEAKVSAYVAALSGPAYALGDDLRSLPDARLAIALDPQVLDLAGGDRAAMPDDPLEAPAEKIVASPVLDAIASPGSTGAPPPTVFGMTGKSGARYRLEFTWTDVHSVSITRQ